MQALPSTSLRRPAMRLLAGGALAAIAMLVTACSSGGASSLTVQQDPPRIVNIDLPDAAGKGDSASHGDLLAFEADLRQDGTVVGDLTGMLTTVDLPDGAASARESLEERIGQLVFRFGGVDTIVVSGSSVYPPDSDEMEAARPQVRAVLGGTGKYLGADGQVTTSLNADGTYEHVFELQ